MSAFALVYFARFCCRIKIGISEDPCSRVFAGLHCDELLGLEAGGRDRESQLHRRFAHCRIQGEWFERHPDLLAYIADLPDDIEVQQEALLRLEIQRLNRAAADLRKGRDGIRSELSAVESRLKAAEKAAQYHREEGSKRIQALRVDAQITAVREQKAAAALLDDVIEGVEEARAS